MLVFTRAAVLLLALPIAACGGGDDDDDGSSEEFLGTYQVTSHRENHQQGTPVSCDDAGPEIQPGDAAYAPVFAVAIDSFFDDPSFLVFQTCDEDGSDCVDTTFHLEVADGHLESIDANTQTGDSCNLYASQSAFTLEDGTATLEHRQWFEFDHPSDDCTLSAAEALIGGPDCRDVVVWTGTPL